MDDRIQDRLIEPGEAVFNKEGRLIGHVNGLTQEGFDVETVEGDAPEDEEEDLPGKEFGEGYIMWRCTECGKMGELEDGMPEECPDCGAPKEAITGERED